MNILKNDEVTLIKEFENLKKIGKIYEVANITDTKIIIRDKKSKVAIAAIEIEIFEEYFKKDYLNGWTKWVGISDGMDNLVAYYRTNHKRVEVKTVDGRFKGKSSCNKTDKFSLDKGIKLAVARCNKKLLQFNKNECEERLNKLNEEITFVDNYIAMIE